MEKETPESLLSRAKMNYPKGTIVKGIHGNCLVQEEPWWVGTDAYISGGHNCPMIYSSDTGKWAEIVHTEHQRIEAQEPQEVLQKVTEPPGKWILDNMKGVVGNDGQYYHYSEVSNAIDQFQAVIAEKGKQLETEIRINEQLKEDCLRVQDEIAEKEKEIEDWRKNQKGLFDTYEDTQREWNNCLTTIEEQKKEIEELKKGSYAVFTIEKQKVFNQISVSFEDQSEAQSFLDQMKGSFNYKGKELSIMKIS